MGKNKKTGKVVLLIMAFSILIMSCAPHKAGDPSEEPDKTVSETQKTEDAANEAESKEAGEGAAGEEIQTDREADLPVFTGEEITVEQGEEKDIPDSAVYNAGEKTTDSGQAGSDKETDYVDRADDEGEIVIPSN